MGTANWHFYVAIFFPVVSELDCLLLEHVVFSDDLDLCLYCHIIFYYGWAKPLLNVLLSKIMEGDCDAMILAAAQAIFWPTWIFLDVCLC